MYDPRNLLKQNPESIKTLILAVLTALVVRGTIVISGEEAAAWGLVIERGLNALYVAPAKKAMTDAEKEKVTSDLVELQEALAPVQNVTNVSTAPAPARRRKS